MTQRGRGLSMDPLQGSVALNKRFSHVRCSYSTSYHNLGLGATSRIRARTWSKLCRSSENQEFPRPLLVVLKYAIVTGNN
jgi:hypothetical protein